MPTGRVAWPDVFGNSSPTIGDFVMRFGVDHTLKRVTGILLSNRVADSVYVAPRIIGGLEGRTDWVNELGAPL